MLNLRELTQNQKYSNQLWRQSTYGRI